MTAIAIVSIICITLIACLVIWLRARNEDALKTLGADVAKVAAEHFEQANAMTDDAQRIHGIVQTALERIERQSQRLNTLEDGMGVTKAFADQVGNLATRLKSAEVDISKLVTTMGVLEPQATLQAQVHDALAQRVLMIEARR